MAPPWSAEWYRGFPRPSSRVTCIAGGTRDSPGYAQLPCFWSPEFHLPLCGAFGRSSCSWGYAPVLTVAQRLWLTMIEPIAPPGRDAATSCAAEGRAAAMPAYFFRAEPRCWPSRSCPCRPRPVRPAEPPAPSECCSSRQRRATCRSSRAGARPSVEDVPAPAADRGAAGADRCAEPARSRCRRHAGLRVGEARGAGEEHGGAVLRRVEIIVCLLSSI